MPNHGNFTPRVQNTIAAARQQKKLEEAVLKLSSMVVEHGRILGRLVTITEVLRKKGHFCDDDIKQMFAEIEATNEQRARKELDTARAELVSKKCEENQQDSSKADAKGDSLRPTETGANENSVGS